MSGERILNGNNGVGEAPTDGTKSHGFWVCCAAPGLAVMAIRVWGRRLKNHRMHEENEPLRSSRAGHAR